MEYTSDQKNALDAIKIYLTAPTTTDPGSYLRTLSGSAGTGKTTLTREIIKLSRRLGMQTICVAPTHKARRVLHNIINTHLFLRTPTTTVSSFLGRQKAHSYIGTQHYKDTMTSKIGAYDLAIVDEVSMITTADYKEISALAAIHKKKILFIGDPFQIPNPAQGYDLHTDPTRRLSKAINPAFSLPGHDRLDTIVRADKENPLLGLYSLLRGAIGTGYSFSELAQSSMTEAGAGYVILDRLSFLEKLVTDTPHFKPGATGTIRRIIAYTNDSVRQYNRLVRHGLGYTASVVKGESLMGYQNMGSCATAEYSIENGQEYIVTDVRQVRDYAIEDHTGLVGLLVYFNEPDTKGPPRKVFMPELEAEENAEILDRVVTLAKRVNATGSTKQDYRNYIGLKSQIVFMENIYSSLEGIYSEREFRSAHPLLYTRTGDVLQEIGPDQPVRLYIEGETKDRLLERYPEILTHRIADTKEISAGERLADSYQVIEKDIDYGYAITAHKSQGSTYHTVYVDELDFNCVRDGWSKRYACPIDRSMERDQLKYVAATRPRVALYIGEGEKKRPLSPPL